MIEGHGDIASVLPNRSDLLFFASGVSNSKETNPAAFKREQELLEAQDRDTHIVYFGSLSVFYTSTPYTRHKLHMESILKTQWDKSTIVRIGNIDWGTNPHTLINHLRRQYKEGKPLEIQDVYRYLVSKDEFLHWVNLIPSWTCEMNIPGRRLKVADIVKEYVL